MEKYEAQVIVNRKDAKHLFEALDKETKIKDRCVATASLKKDSISIIIKAKDASSFRAALNTYLRIIQSTENI